MHDSPMQLGPSRISWNPTVQTTVKVTRVIPPSQTKEIGTFLKAEGDTFDGNEAMGRLGEVKLWHKNPNWDKHKYGPTNTHAEIGINRPFLLLVQRPRHS